MGTKRKYPVGIQSFENMRRDGYLYVDKTPLIYKMITEGYPYFLSRPRRFGKSLLVSTLQAVFEGRRELFEAFTTEDGVHQPQLYIARSDWKWEAHPVLRFDFSETNTKKFVTFDKYVEQTLVRFEQRYDLSGLLTEGTRDLASMVRAAHRKTGKRVVILVDEYDTLMLHNIGDAQQEEQVREDFAALFGPLKSLDEHLKFIFITGITKFSQMGIFSQLNMLNNISMVGKYDSICGISEEELTTQLRPDVEHLASRSGLGCDEMMTLLKKRYDGYHFSEQLTDIYNPFSLFNAFASGQLKDYWFSSATPRSLLEMLAEMPPLQMTDMEGKTYPSSMFDLSFNNYDNPVPVLYQSGYLTIKDCRYFGLNCLYTLGFPNEEVRTGFADCLYQHVAAVKGTDNNKAGFLVAYSQFTEDDDLPRFMDAVRTFFAGVPYQLNNHNEHHYHALLYTLLVAFGADIVAEESSAKGRADLVLRMPNSIYVIELKYDDTAEAALSQIVERGYAEKYAHDGRRVVMVGIAFSSQERNITDWQMRTHATWQ